jgi:hypothetical protein
VIDVTIFEAFLQIEFQDIDLGPERFHLGKRVLVEDGQQRARERGIADDADGFLVEAGQQPDGDGVADIEVHAETAGKVNALDLPGGEPGGFEKGLDPGADCRLCLEEEGDVDFADPLGAGDAHGASAVFLDAMIRWARKSM